MALEPGTWVLDGCGEEAGPYSRPHLCSVSVSKTGLVGSGVRAWVLLLPAVGIKASPVCLLTPLEPPTALLGTCLPVQVRATVLQPQLVEAGAHTWYYRGIMEASLRPCCLMAAFPDPLHPS